MTRIADLLARDFSRPIEETVKVTNDDPDSVFSELTEYIATDRIKAAYERLFSAMAAASKSPNEGVGIWISGSFGSGKSHFAKNLGYVLANREVHGTPASSLFLKQVNSSRVAECVGFLNSAAPYEIFKCDIPVDVSSHANTKPLAEVMYRAVLGELDYAEDFDIAEASPSVQDLVERSFERCKIRSHGKSFAFLVDEMDAGERLEDLCAVVEQFGKESFRRLEAGEIPGPVWIIVTAEKKLPDLPKLQDLFPHQIDLSPGDLPEIATRRVLRKKESQDLILRKLFRDKGASLIQSVRLERCSRRTEFDEDQFVQFYPYLPHLLNLSMDVMAGIRLRPDSPNPGSGNRTIVKQCLEMLVSDRTRLANLPVETLVSIDKVYELVEENIPPHKQKYILEIGQRFDNDQDYPGMAGRVVKAICLMEFAKTDPPCTTRNIAALLVQRVTEAPPILAVAAILSHLKEAGAVRETNHGWRLFDFQLLRNVADALEGLRYAVGKVNPRPPGWHNDLIQLGKRLLARLFNWYTRPLQEYNAALNRAIEEIVCALDRLSTDAMPPDQASRDRAALNHVSMNSVALETRLVRLENRSAGAAASGPCLDGGAGSDRTAYIIGLFGTGRRYINELMLQNIGERAKYFTDGLRLHPGPTPMIYSGHATMRYASRQQESPAVMSGILEAVRSGFADSIFIYRHPLDSLLTNWIWWRTFLRDNRWISGISQVYSNTDDLSADLEQNFCEFQEFAEGHPDFFVSLPGPPFLSFAEFAEETELHLQAATLTLRLEDFMVDPLKEFSKIAKVMSVDVDLSRLRVPPPITRPYGHLAVKEKVPRFRDFIDGLNAETKRRIDEIGYKSVG